MNDKATLKALKILGMLPQANRGKGIVFISKKTGRRYAVLESGRIMGFSQKSNWTLGKGGLSVFLEKVCARPKSYLGI
jgi:hypothetical protein